jgi:hypothetical protein
MLNAIEIEVEKGKVLNPGKSIFYSNTNFPGFN